MLDIGWTEILVIGALALIVVGPKDLPGMLRTVGQFMGKARSMAREFQRSMEEAAREADLGDVADTVKGGKSLKKSPFGDNSVTRSLKDFQSTVKSELSDAASAADEGARKAGDRKTPAKEADSAAARIEKAKRANAAAESYTPPSPLQEGEADAAEPPERKSA